MATGSDKVSPPMSMMMVSGGGGHGGGGGDGDGWCIALEALCVGNSER